MRRAPGGINPLMAAAGLGSKEEDAVGRKKTEAQSIEAMHGADYLEGGAGDDFLFGEGGNDILAGGIGNDILDGGVGDDTYVFAAGDGDDTVLDTGGSTNDKLLLHGITFADATITKAVNGTIDITDSTGDHIRIQTFAGDPSSGVEQIVFDDATLDIASLAAQPTATPGGPDWATFGDDIDVIDAAFFRGQAPGGFTMIDAGGGNDVIIGTPDAYLYGNEGNDTITGGQAAYGGAGDDILEGSGTLEGGTGDDLFIADGGTRILINAGDGNDTVRGVGDFLAFEDAYFQQLGIPVWQFRLEHGGQFQFFEAGQETPSFFNSREALTLRLIELGFTVEDAQSFTGLTIIDPLPSVPPQLAGNDYAAFKPYVQSGLIKADTLVLGPDINLANITITREQENTGNGLTDVALLIGTGGANSVRVELAAAQDPIGTGIEFFEFPDGTTTWIGDLLAQAVPVLDLQGTNGDDVITGTNNADRISGLAGNDGIDGGAGDNFLIGGTGNDVLSGGIGNDTYIFNAGDGIDHIQDTATINAGNNLQFGAGITSDMLSLGLGSLAININDGFGDVVHLDNVDPNDVYGAHAVEKLHVCRWYGANLRGAIAAWF